MEKHGGGPNTVLAIGLIGLGGLLLLNNLGIDVRPVWMMAGRYWPVLLILWGLELVVGKLIIRRLVESLLTAVVVIILALYILRIFNLPVEINWPRNFQWKPNNSLFFK